MGSSNRRRSVGVSILQRSHYYGKTSSTRPLSSLDQPPLIHLRPNSTILIIVEQPPISPSLTVSRKVSPWIALVEEPYRPPVKLPIELVHVLGMFV